MSKPRISPPPRPILPTPDDPTGWRHNPRTSFWATFIAIVAFIALLFFMICFTGCGATEAMDELEALEVRIGELEAKLDAYMAIGAEKDAEVLAMIEETSLALAALRRYQARLAQQEAP